MPRTQALILQAFARDAGFDNETIAGAALHARATALAKWTVTHDPDRHSAGSVVMEAAARFPLREGKHGIEFEPAGFQELLLFIEKLPW